MVKISIILSAVFIAGVVCLPTEKAVRKKYNHGVKRDGVKRTAVAGCSSDEFDCGNECIPASWKCDGWNDCSYGEDELSCGCTSDEFDCGVDGCIPGYKECDGKDDCSGGIDELFCDSCSSVEFDCGNNECIPENWKCDGIADCLNGKDEESCATGPCSSEDFYCGNGQCIFSSWECDGMEDCLNGNDELSCGVCFSHEFQCSTGACIDGNYLCDRIIDCPDASDETNCGLTSYDVDARNLERKSRMKAELNTTLNEKSKRGNTSTLDGIMDMVSKRQETKKVKKTEGKETRHYIRTKMAKRMLQKRGMVGTKQEMRDVLKRKNAAGKHEEEHKKNIKTRKLQRKKEDKRAETKKLEANKEIKQGQK